MLVENDNAAIESPCKRLRPRSASPETATANKARKQDKLYHHGSGLEVIRGKLCFAERPSADDVNCNRRSSIEKMTYPLSVKSSSAGDRTESRKDSDLSSDSSSYYMTTRLAPTQAYTNTEEDDAPTSTTNLSLSNKRAGKR